MSKVYISSRASVFLKEYLVDVGHELIEMKKTNRVYDAVADHPDIYMCRLPRKIVFAEEKELGYKYPQNIAFNAAWVGRFLIHNTEYTAKRLIELAKEEGLELVKVKQGYAKCNICVVDENSIITSDKGIAKVTESVGIKVLLIEEGHIKLEGFPFGFIGGASGKIGDEVIFNGNLREHPDFGRIEMFVTERRVRLKYFENYELEDIGSIIEGGGSFEKSCNNTYFYPS